MTVIARRTVVAHWPTVGVKVYVAVAVLLTVAGLQVPVMPSFEARGRTGAVAPEQSEVFSVKVGVMAEPTVIVRLMLWAHWPAVGVKL